MQAKRRVPFTTVRTEGSILPADLLQRLIDRDGSLEGLTPRAYHLADETLNEAVNNAWNRVTEKWRKFRESLSKLPETSPATADTRDRWLFPLFDALGYGRLLPAKPITIEEKSYPLTHSWGNTPVHLVGARVDLDRRQPGNSGANRTSPHGMLQELLNRSDRHLWGFLSNGRRLRILRDNASLIRQAFVEFDLEAMMDGGAETYGDFTLLWLLCHQSRVEADRPEDCWLERWSRAAQEQGARALDQLRGGVEDAITALGQGFLNHRENHALRESLRSGRLSRWDYFRQVLRLVYRLIFLFVAEDRGLLFDPETNETSRSLYEKYYSTSRLRKLADKRSGSRHGDLYQMLRLVMGKLGDQGGCPELGLPALDGFLWAMGSIADLVDAQIANRDLLEAIRALSFSVEGNVRRSVDYKNLGTEELGSVYESLLELQPELDVEAGKFRLETVRGNERKTTGSYYTPPSLVRCILDSALDPVLEEAAAAPDPERAILDLKVCDPACGSGHFLIAAAHRMGRRLATVRAGEVEPSPEEVRRAIRDIIGRCLYGVDLNPDAVELCKVALWMEALVPGRPLTFLDHHIQRGNSLLGATPALLKMGVPDQAFEVIEGDDKSYSREWRRRNQDDRRGYQSLFEQAGWSNENFEHLANAIADINRIPDDTIEGIQEKHHRYTSVVDSSNYRYSRLLADAWCSTFVWKKVRDFPSLITEQVYRRLEQNPHDITPWMEQEIRRLAGQYAFFHWHIAYPDVFRLPASEESPDNPETGWSGGFDVVLGNPPWERLKIQEQEWFARHRPDIAKAANAAARRKLINHLADEDPALHQAFLEDRRQAEGESHLVRNSGRYPLCGRGDVNTYAVFAELNRQLIRTTGRVGCIVPTGIATDETTKLFFQDLIESESLVSLFSFENEEHLFPGVDHRVRFCLITMAGPDRPRAAADLVFFARRPEHLLEPDRHFTLSVDEIRLLNPNSGTCPIFRSQRDAEINKAVYSRLPVLIQDGPAELNPWSISFMVMFHMANDSHLFRTREQLEADCWVLDGNVFLKNSRSCVPLYEAKMLHHFDHRFGTYEGQSESQSNQGKLPELGPTQHDDPFYTIMPRYWVPSEEVDRRMRDRWDRRWFLGWRDICRNTDQRTVIASLLPWAGVGHTFPLAFPAVEDRRFAGLLYANLTTFVFDYLARQKIGGTHLTYGLLKQLPVIPPDRYRETVSHSGGMTWVEWLMPRILELTYTAWDLQPFARDCGYDGPPFHWDEERRFLLRCELDAAYFRLYGIQSDDAAFILDTFLAVGREKQLEHGVSRIQRTILEMAEQFERIAPGNSPSSSIQPPAADPSLRHTEAVGDRSR